VSRLVPIAALLIALAGAAFAEDPAELKKKYAQPKGMPAEVGASVQVVDKRNTQLPLDARFDDESGKKVTFGELLHADRPVLLQFVYFRCPGLCNAVLNGTLDTLSELEMEIGKDFDLITVSISPTETSNLARSKKEAYLHQLGRPEAAPGWHFLTGSEAQIRKLTDAAGFGFQWDEERHEYAHGAALFVVTPKGVLSNTVYGAHYYGRTVRLSLVEAADGKIGNALDRVLLFCYHFDPTTGLYTTTIMSVTRVVGLLFVTWLLGMVAIYLWRERRRAKAGETPALSDAPDPTPEPATAGGNA
jgi:protein SCO1/2